MILAWMGIKDHKHICAVGDRYLDTGDYFWGSRDDDRGGFLPLRHETPECVRDR